MRPDPSTVALAVIRRICYRTRSGMRFKIRYSATLSQEYTTCPRLSNTIYMLELLVLFLVTHAQHLEQLLLHDANQN